MLFLTPYIAGPCIIRLGNLYKTTRGFPCNILKHNLSVHRCQEKRKVKNFHKLKVLFFGSDNFSVVTLKHLTNLIQDHDLVAVVSVPTEKSNPVKKFAEEHNLAYYDWPISLKRNEYDIGLVVSFGKLIPEHIIDAFPLGMLNVHASLLPRWRGAAPIIRAVMNGDPETGISIMRIRPKKFDIGEILLQSKCEIFPDETANNLSKRLSEMGGLLLVQCLKNLSYYMENATSQPKEGVTHAFKVKSSDAVICWEKLTSCEVYNRFRALSEKYPLTTNWQGLTVKLIQIANPTLHCEEDFKPDHCALDVSTGVLPQDLVNEITSKHCNKSVVDIQSRNAHSGSTLQNSEIEKNDNSLKRSEEEPGCVKYDRKNRLLKVKCADGKWIRLSKISLHGKKTMSALDFYNGFVSKKDITERYFT